MKMYLYQFTFFYTLIKSETFKDIEDDDYDLELLIAKENGNFHKNVNLIDANQLKLNLFQRTDNSRTILNLPNMPSCTCFVKTIQKLKSICGTL